MLRYLQVLCFLLVCLGMLSTTAYSNYRFHDGSKMEIQWHEKEGQILLEKVCFNYKKSRSKYRQCRRKAVDYFQDECEFYTKKMKTTHQKYRSMYEPERQKFCSASDEYKP